MLNLDHISYILNVYITYFKINKIYINIYEFKIYILFYYIFNIYSDSTKVFHVKFSMTRKIIKNRIVINR